LLQKERRKRERRPLSKKRNHPLAREKNLGETKKGPVKGEKNKPRAAFGAKGRAAAFPCQEKKRGAPTTVGA